MRLSTVLFAFLFPSLGAAFAPAANYHHHVTTATTTSSAASNSPLFRRASLVSEPDALHDLSDTVSSKLESVMEKADDLVLKRAMVSAEVLLLLLLLPS